jgi:hypothetical protein
MSQAICVGGVQTSTCQLVFGGLVRFDGRMTFAVAGLALSCAIPVRAQEWKPEAPPPQKIAAIIDLIRGDLSTQKKSIVNNVMQFSEADAKRFWPIYEQYQMEYSQLGNETAGLIKEYVESLDTMTDSKAASLMARTFDLRKRALALRIRYYEMVSRALTPIKAAKFMQIDSQLVGMLDLQISSNLPFIR